MKLFKRRPWVTIWKEYGYASMRQRGRDFQLPSKTVVQVKELRDGTYKARAFVATATDGSHLANITVDYALYECKEANDGGLQEALNEYNITT